MGFGKKAAAAAAAAVIAVGGGALAAYEDFSSDYKELSDSPAIVEEYSAEPETLSYVAEYDEVTTVKPTTTKKATTTKKTTTAESEIQANNSNGGITVYRTATGQRYHYENPCGNGKYYPISLAEAERLGLTPCDKCVNH